MLLVFIRAHLLVILWSKMCRRPLLDAYSYYAFVQWRRKLECSGTAKDTLDDEFMCLLGRA